MSEALPTKHEKDRRFRTRTSRLIGRAAVSLAAGAVLALPVAATGTLEHAKVHDDAGLVPTTISASPSHSSIDFGVFGSLYDQSMTENGLGVRVEVNGLPDVQTSIKTENLEQLVEPFKALYDNPQATADGYAAALKNELKQEFISRQLETTIVLGTIGFLLSSVGGRMSARDRRRYLTATFGSVSALSLLASAQSFNQWQTDNAYPGTTYSIAAAPGATAGSIETDSQLLATLINKVVPTIEEQRQRNQTEVSNFLDTAKRSIDAQLADEKFKPPQEGETVVLALSDIHSNQAMITIYQYLVDSINKKYGAGTLELTLLVGDQTYGSASEITTIDEISQISDDVYGISGNHDSGLIAERSKSRGINLLEGKTKTATDGITVLGAPDPSLTRLSSALSFGKKNILRSQDVRGQKHLGRILDAEAEATNPTFVLSHEAYALNKLIDKDDISVKSMKDWFGKDGRPADTEVPASSVLYGHWHGEFDYRVVRDAQGDGSVVAELGTAGGAPNKASLNRLPLPWATPTQQASAVIFYVDSDSQLITGLQEINTSRSGSVRFQKTETITQPDDSGSLPGVDSPGETPLRNESFAVDPRE